MHPSAAAPAPMAQFTTQCDPKKFDHPWTSGYTHTQIPKATAETLKITFSNRVSQRWVKKTNKHTCTYLCTFAFSGCTVIRELFLWFYSILLRIASTNSTTSWKPGGVVLRDMFLSCFSRLWRSLPGGDACCSSLVLTDSRSRDADNSPRRTAA